MAPSARARMAIAVGKRRLRGRQRGAAVAPVAAESQLLRGFEDEPCTYVIAVGEGRRCWGQRSHIRCGSGFSCRRKPVTGGLEDEPCPYIVAVSKRRCRRGQQ